MNESEQELVVQAQAVYAGHGDQIKLRNAFNAATLMVKCDLGEGLSTPVTAVPGMGTWLCAFSSLDRLASVHGPCDYFSTTGEDVMTNILPDLSVPVSGVFLDLGTGHQLAFPREPVEVTP